MIDVAIPSDRTVIQTEAEKKLKCKNPSIVIQRMRNMKCFVIPVTIVATGIITKGIKQSGNSSWKSFNGSCIRNSCTMDITRNKESDSYSLELEA
jgi:hypothetical protein